MDTPKNRLTLFGTNRYNGYQAHLRTYVLSIGWLFLGVHYFLLVAVRWTDRHLPWEVARVVQSTSSPRLLRSIYEAKYVPLQKKLYVDVLVNSTKVLWT